MPDPIHDLDDDNDNDGGDGEHCRWAEIKAW